MGDENPIRTLGDYSKPSHEGYRNTIELPEGNNVVPLRSDTIRLVQNGCSFYGLWSEDQNQHLKDFLKLGDSLDLDAGSLSIWEDLLTRFLCSSLSTKSGPHDIQYCMKNPEQASVDYTSSCINEVGGKRFTPNQGPRNFNEATNTWKDKPNFNWAHTQTITAYKADLSYPFSSFQMKLEKVLLDFDSNHEKSDTKEEDVSSTNACDLNLGSMVKGKEEVKEQGIDERRKLRDCCGSGEVIEEKKCDIRGLIGKLKKYSRRRKMTKMVKTLTHSQL
ncbi:hypothetical protein Tco_0232987 [Tanacetum coccineum]